MNIAEAVAAFSASPSMAPVVVTDSSANCAAYLDAIQTLAASNKISKLTVTDTQPLTISYTQLSTCGAAVALLPSTRCLVVTDTPAAASLTPQSNTRVLSFSVTDSSAQIAKYFSALNVRTRLSAIVPTDNTAIGLTASQFTTYTFSRSRLPAETRYAITKASIAETIAIREDTAIQSIAVSDTNCAIVARLCDLAATPGVIGSIKATDATMITMSQASLLAKANAVTALGAVLSVSITGIAVARLADVQAFVAVRAMAVADTAAAIAAGATALNTAAKATTLKAVSVTDGSLIELTSATYKAVTSLRRVLDASARLSVSGLNAAAAGTTQADATVAVFTVRDTATNIIANLPGLSAATKIATISLSSGNTLTLAADVYAANGTALSHLAGGISLNVMGATTAAAPAILGDARVTQLTISDTWAGLRAGLEGLHNDLRIARINLTDGGTVTLDADTYLPNRPMLGRLAIAPGQMTVTDAHTADIPLILSDNHVGTIAARDSLAHVAANLDYLSTLARAGTLSAVVVADIGQTATLTAAELASGAAALALTSGSFSVVEATAPSVSEPPLFNLLWDSSVADAPDGFVAAVEYAARYLDSLIVNHITLNVVIDYGHTNNQPLAANILGNTTYDTAVNVGFAQLQDAYAHHNGSAATAAAIANMTAPPNGAQVNVIAGQAKALGLLPAVSNAVDAEIGFAADPNGTYFTYDPNARSVAGRYDFISVAEHELSHALGRISVGSGIYTGLDMFRYSAPGVRAEAGSASYFSIDGGTTRLADFATKGNGDWATTAGTDTFAAYVNPSAEYDVGMADVTVLAAMGYRMDPAAPAVDPAAINPSRGLNAPELSFIGSPASTAIGTEGASLAFTLAPASGVHEIGGFTYGRDQLLLDTSAMPGNLIAYDSLIDGQHAVTLTSSADTSFGVILTGLGDGHTAGELMLSHLTRGAGQALIA